MAVRFYVDTETGRPHVEGHGVTEQEVLEVLQAPLEDREGAEGSRVAVGCTQAGRYLRVIYVPDRESDDLFVITAYDLTPKARRALRRRLRRKP